MSSKKHSYQYMTTHVSSAEKCLIMCGLEAFADAMVGSLGIEQRKRTTIGVELAAKASADPKDRGY